jgi:predicted component of type VI protein secretion system
MQVRLEVSHKKANVRRVVLRKDALIGRSKECNLRIASNGVSREHCRILLREPHCFVRDLKSANGTFVDGEQIPSEQDVRLKSGSRLSVGPVQFVVQVIAKGKTPSKTQKPTKAAAKSPPPEEAAQPNAALEKTVLEQDMMPPAELAETEFAMRLDEEEAAAEAAVAEDGELYALAAPAEAEPADVETAEPAATNDGDYFDADAAFDIVDDDLLPVPSEEAGLPLAEPASDDEVPARKAPQGESADEMDDETAAFLALMDVEDEPPAKKKPAAAAPPRGQAKPKPKPKPKADDDPEETLSEFLKTLEDD